MSRPDHKKWRFWAGLLAICVLYTIYNLYLSDLDYVESTSRGVRHVVRFLTILAAYGIGLWAFGRDYPSWLVQVWHIAYAGLLGLLILLGLYDLWVAEIVLWFRNLIITLQEFLISPVPFVIAGLINRLAGAQPVQEV